MEQMCIMLLSVPEIGSSVQNRKLETVQFQKRKSVFHLI